jgi:hypothetical protein
MQEEKTSTSLISIERVVAFVVGPAVVAVSGWASTQLLKLGVHVSAPEVTAAFATGGLAAAGLVWKWLDGRQKDLAPVLKPLESGLSTADKIPGVEGMIHTTLQDLEGLAQHAATQAVSKLLDAKSAPSLDEKSAPSNAGAVEIQETNVTKDGVTIATATDGEPGK